MKQLVLGGARSGKSQYAENQALSSGDHCSTHFYYIATATKSNDKEMSDRIIRHQQQRDKRWQLIEEPLDIASIINTYHSSTDCILIDCLTLWLTNALMDNVWSTTKADFLNALTQTEASIYLVSNEVGSGIVPLGELSRQFVDEAGWLHQSLAEQCDSVNLIVAGLPLKLK